MSGAAFVLAVAFLSTRTCKSDSVSGEIRFQVGDAGPSLRRLEAELVRPGEDEVLGFYRQSFNRGTGRSAGRWPLRADAGLYRLRIELTSTAGRVRVERGVDLQDGAVVTIDLERDLAGR